jgi:hypothetical protein
VDDQLISESNRVSGQKVGGLAAGGWLAGILYDHFGFYAPAFAAGLAVNVLNFMIIGALSLRRYAFPVARL